MNEHTRTRIVLIRHAESVAWTERIVGGHNGCRGLTELGRRQAEALRDRIERSGELREASVLLSSVLPRAVETAEIIAAGVGDGSLRIDSRCDLCELHVGEGDGLGWDEFVERYGEPRDDHDAVLSPGSESVRSFTLRARSALRSLAEEHTGKTVVVATHGGVVFSSMDEFGGLDFASRAFELHPENTALTVWSRSDGRWRLERYNDAAHLAGL